MCVIHDFVSAQDSAGYVLAQKQRIAKMFNHNNKEMLQLDASI